MINQGMILAAGLGKRLQPLTLTTPKPLIELAGRPLIQYALDRYLARRLKKIVVNTHYLAIQMADYLAGWPVIISHEEELLETGGGIAKALPHFNGYPFFSLNSDIWWQDNANNSLDALEASWDETTMDALLLLVHRQNALNYDGAGDFLWDEATLTPTFRPSDIPVPYIFTGIQLLHPRLFNSCPEGRFSVVELYQRAAKNQRLKAIVLNGEWSDVGTVTALNTLRQRLTNG